MANVLEDAIRMMLLPEFENKWILFPAQTMMELCEEAKYPYGLFNDFDEGDICLRAHMNDITVEFIVVKDKKALHKKAHARSKKTLRLCDAYVNQILSENGNIIRYSKPENPDGEIVIV